MAGVNERHRKRTRAREGGEFRAGEKYEAGEGKREREKERERHLLRLVRSFRFGWGLTDATPRGQNAPVVYRDKIV